MTTLRERKTNRKAILRSLYGAVEHNRPEVSGSALRAELGLPDEDLSAACAYLADEGLISVDWTSHRTPAAVSLTHEGVRLMEQLEEEQEVKREKAQEEQSDD
jgi:2-polyprenyl-6-methoxyphenol hydroxylase-like FAD-dependent oxidoreductase